MKKPHYRLRFHLFDGKTPLWWVTRHKRASAMWISQTTGGFTNSGDAIRAAAAL